MVERSVEDRMGEALRHWASDAPQKSWLLLTPIEREWWCARAEYLQILMRRRGLKVVVQEGDSTDA